MGKLLDPSFQPLPREKAVQKEWTINEAERKGEAVVIDADKGLTGTMPVSLITPNTNTIGLARYGRHFAGGRL